MCWPSGLVLTLTEKGRTFLISPGMDTWEGRSSCVRCTRSGPSQGWRRWGLPGPAGRRGRRRTRPRPRTWCHPTGWEGRRTCPGRSAPGRRRRTQHRTRPASCSCTDSGILMVWLQCGRDTRCKKKCLQNFYQYPNFSVSTLGRWVVYQDFFSLFIWMALIRVETFSTSPLYLLKWPYSTVTIFSGSLVSKMASTQGAWDPITRTFFPVTFMKSAALCCGGHLMFSIIFKWSYLGHKMCNIGVSLKSLSSLEFVH